MKKEHLEMLAQMPIKDFIQRLQIVNKDGQVQSLLLNAQQEVILDALLGGNDLLILKCRQIGSTTINIAYLFALAYLSLEPITFAIFSYKLSSSKHILEDGQSILQWFAQSTTKRSGNRQLHRTFLCGWW
jgi:hypothetical protein